MTWIDTVWCGPQSISVYGLDCENVLVALSASRIYDPVLIHSIRCGMNEYLRGFTRAEHQNIEICGDTLKICFFCNAILWQGDFRKGCHGVYVTHIPRESHFGPRNFPIYRFREVQNSGGAGFRAGKKSIVTGEFFQKDRKYQNNPYPYH